MNTSPEIIGLLEQIAWGKIGRSLLAEWLAVNSLRFLGSPNVSDRAVMADLDAALGEVQRGVQSEEFLKDVARELKMALEQSPAEEQILVDLSGSSVLIYTGSSNVGEVPSSQVTVEIDHPLSRTYR